MSDRIALEPPIRQMPPVVARNEAGSHETAHNRPRAFTLVELLVVIGIIVVLISILLPTLAAARHSANVVRWKAYMAQLRVNPDVVALYDFQVDDWDMAADASGHIHNPTTTLENKAIGDPSDRLTTVRTNLNGTFAGNLTGNVAQNPTWVKGRWNGKGALNFTSTLFQYVDCGNARDWSRISYGLTVAVWFKPVDTSSGNIVGREYGPTHTGAYYAWDVYDKAGYPQVRTDRNATNSPTAMRQQDWNHIVFTYGCTSVHQGSMYGNVYQDDVKANYYSVTSVQSGSSSFSVYPTTQNVRIGAAAGSAESNLTPHDPLNGQIDEIVIFKETMQDNGMPVPPDVDKLYLIGQAARE